MSLPDEEAQGRGPGDQERQRSGPLSAHARWWVEICLLVSDNLFLLMQSLPTPSGYKLARRAARLAKTKAEFDARARDALPDFDEESTADEAGPAAHQSSDDEPPKKRRSAAAKAAPVAGKGKGKANADSSDDSDAERTSGKHVFAPREASASFMRAPAEPNSPEGAALSPPNTPLLVMLSIQSLITCNVPSSIPLLLPWPW